jgi:Na+/H+ antiporter NhaC
MSPQLISIYALVAMFVVATILPINMGVLAFVGAFLVGTLVAGQTTSAIIAGFPGGLFLTLVGITFLFAIAQNNGTIDWLVRLAVRGVRGRIVAIPWIMFGISAVLTSVGAVSPGAVAIIAPIALGFALKYSINPLLMGLMVVHGAQAGGFSPISIYGGITNRVVAKAGLPLNEIVTFLASFGVNLAVAVLLFFALGGRRLLQARADVSAGQATANAATAAQPPASRAPAAVAGTVGNLALAIPPVAVTVPQAGPQVYGTD